MEESCSNTHLGTTFILLRATLVKIIVKDHTSDLAQSCIKIESDLRDVQAQAEFFQSSQNAYLKFISCIGNIEIGRHAEILDTDTNICLFSKLFIDLIFTRRLLQSSLPVLFLKTTNFKSGYGYESWTLKKQKRKKIYSFYALVLEKGPAYSLDRKGDQ